MAAIALTSFLDDDGKAPEGMIVTVVLPGGCQLDCPFCIVKHRRERNSGAEALSPKFFSGLLRQHAAGAGLAGGAIVGDEPLQESVWSYVLEFLRTCESLGRPSAMITNGVELAAFAVRLDAFSTTKVLVSLDAVGAAHDEVRGRAGTFDAVLTGLRAVEKTSNLGRRLTVATVFRPGRLADAEAVLRLVAGLGMPNWILSPLLDPRPNRPMRVHPKAAQEYPEALRHLGRVAATLGVTMVASDEFGLLPDVDKLAREVGFVSGMPRSHPHLIRVDANGVEVNWSDLRRGFARADAEGFPPHLEHSGMALA